MEIIGEGCLGAPRFELGRIRGADRPITSTALRIIALLTGIGIIAEPCVNDSGLTNPDWG